VFEGVEVAVGLEEGELLAFNRDAGAVEAPRFVEDLVDFKEGEVAVKVAKVDFELGEEAWQEASADGLEFRRDGVDELVGVVKWKTTLLE